jgi:hypothetical protein
MLALQDNIKVILRKHRDVFFDINIKQGATYMVESTSDFYSPRDKKLLRKCKFQDGDLFHLWIGREFKGRLVLKSGEKILGNFDANKLDSRQYDGDPKTKPEPLMVVFGKKEVASSLVCAANDPFGVSDAQGIFKPMFDPKLASLKNYGTEFQYHLTPQEPEVKEYACVADALAHEILPQVLKQLDSGQAVEGTVSQIFIAPNKNSSSGSGLYNAMAVAIAYLSPDPTVASILTSNPFKETAGYLQEHWRALDKILMRVRIEKRVIGKYRVVFKGRPLAKSAAQLFGAAANASVLHKKMPLGSSGSAFLDGGFGRTGKGGFGGMKRLMLTTTENFRGGVKIQIIGTVIDLIGDANTVYFDKDGSKDLSEFLGRAGVSIVKAGATAVIGRAFAALITMGGAAVFAAGMPVLLAAAIVVAGYILAATIVDVIDDTFKIKSSVADWVK